MADKPWELIAADVPVDKFQGKRFHVLQCPEDHFLLVDASFGAVMRIIAFLSEPAVIDRILTHLRTRAPPAPARDPPSLTRRLRTVGTAPRALRP